MDGSGASILFMHAGGKKENVHWVAAGKFDEHVEDGKVIADPNIPILIVDISPNDEGANFLHKRGNFQVIDHHKSAERFAAEPNFLISVGNFACGTEMFRQWLARQDQKFDRAPFKRFASLIDDHDRWVRKQPMSIEMPRLFAFIGQKKFVQSFYDVEYRFKEEKESYWFEHEKFLLDELTEGQAMRHEYLIKNKFVKLRRQGLAGDTITIGYIVSAEVNCSELLHSYLNANPDVDIACQINLDIDKVSLRSNGKVDLSKFAKLYNGGGHSDAAGHGLPDGLIKGIIEGMHA
jgi:oligoribonuclease NrnB/cAMP/cGMP phosphodiesterase (DHH superfamily)